jgi:DNA ligase D-like protein (predicted 3'-phosphoesterase)
MQGIMPWVHLLKMPKKPIFVVHEHHATHLHWDLRIEMDGVLKSWAVPKKPPTKKGVKRLAVQVDDHDLSYAGFEGEIPEGQYGAGKVLIWDKGSYDLADRSADKIVVDFKGKKLKGKYALIRFKKAGEKNWLFFKL